MTVSKAVERLAEDFDLFAYSHFGYSLNKCSKCPAGGMAKSLSLSLQERELGIELLLRLSSALKRKITSVNIYIRATEFTKVSYVEDGEDSVTIAII